MTVTAFLSGIVAIIKASIPHLLALLIALVSGWWLYHHEQNRKLDRSLAALLFDSSQNLVVLQAVIQRGNWRESSIDSRFADPTVARALLSDASVFTTDLDRGVVMAIVHYAQQMEATRMTMQFMEERFVKQGHLTEVNLSTLDRICRNGITAARVLQRHLDSQMLKRKIRLGTREEGHRFAEELRREDEQVRSEMRREDRKGEGREE